MNRYGDGSGQPNLACAELSGRQSPQLDKVISPRDLSLASIPTLAPLSDTSIIIASPEFCKQTP